MIRLFKVKEKQKELAENANGGAPIKKQSAGELRLHKGLLVLFIELGYLKFPFNFYGVFHLCIAYCFIFMEKKDFE